ncbi:DUF3426 domain-containing protein [Oxalobacteraceae bacterium A2-2]
MALATKCPHCNTVFRVAHDQLKLRGGIVRCGACDEVFDGNAALVEPPPPVSPPLPSTVPPFDARMAALDTRAAQALQPQEEAPLALELGEQAPEDIEALPAPESLAAFEAPPEPKPEPESEPEYGPETKPEQAPSSWPYPAPGSERAPEPQAVAEATPAPPPAPEWPLELDLDVDAAPDHGPALQIEEDTPPALPPASATLLEQELAMEAAPPSDTELADTLETELATLSETVGHTLEPLPDGFPSDDGGRREPTFGPHPDQARDTPATDDDDDADLAALVQLSGAGQDAAMRAAAGAGPDGAAGSAGPAASTHSAGSGDSGAGAGDGAPAEAGAASAADPDVAATNAAALPLSRSAPAGDDAAPAPGGASRAASSAPAAAAEAAPGDEPGFVTRARRRQRYGKATAIAMGAGSVLLLAALGGQVIATFRNPLAASRPQLKPALASACAALGCKIELPTQIDEVSIEQGELQTLSETTFSFTTLLRNQSGTAQAWPHIELKLDDASDKTILRRVFAPRDYLPPNTTPEQGFAPHSEQSVKLYFELAQLKASGYHIAVFYP